jgi:Uma2 family endonuclease
MTSPSTAAYEMTAEKFFQLPEGPPYFELIDGDLYMAPSPLRLHQRILVRLTYELQSCLEDHPIGEFYVAPSDVVFSDNIVLNPDLYYVRNERRSILADHGATGAPDLVVEILSPSTAQRDVGRKREIYAESGVEEFWVVSPKTRAVEVYRLGENPAEPIVVLAETDVLTSALFPGWSLAVADVFRE